MDRVWWRMKPTQKAMLRASESEKLIPADVVKPWISLIIPCTSDLPGPSAFYLSKLVRVKFLSLAIKSPECNMLSNFIFM